MKKKKVLKKEEKKKKRKLKEKKRNNDLKLELEALLFSSAKPLTIDQISLMFKEKKKIIRNYLMAIKKDYENRETAIKVIEINNSWQMTVKDKFIPVIKEVVVDTELNKAVLDTLAVIAYKYPKIKQSDIIKARGTGAYEHIKELIKKGFITREKKGNSFLIKLTEKFFEYFDVDNDKTIKNIFNNVFDKNNLLNKLDSNKIVIVDEEPNMTEEKNEDEEINRELKEPIIDEEKQKKEIEYLNEFDSRLNNIKENIDKEDIAINNNLLEENKDEKKEDEKIKKEDYEVIPDIDL